MFLKKQQISWANYKLYFQIYDFLSIKLSQCISKGPTTKFQLTKSDNLFFSFELFYLS